jgi:STE24 endopeptidase
VEVDEVVVNDAATRSRTFNARVEGIGATRRVVLFDTVIDEGDRDQLRWTVAHELAHEKDQHIAKGVTGYMLMMVPLALLTAGVVALLTGAGSGRPDMNLTLRRTSIAAGVIVVLLALSAPIQNAVSRAYEAEADATALEITGEPLAAIRARVASRTRSRADPDPPRYLHLWFGSHPTALERVGAATRALGQP